MKLKVFDASKTIVSVKVWSVPTTSEWNPREYRTRFTKYHTFLTDKIYTHTPSTEEFKYVLTHLYLHEMQVETIDKARKYIVSLSDMIRRDNVDFWLGTLALNGIIDYEGMGEMCAGDRKLYCLCEGLTETAKVYHFMQIDMIRPSVRRGPLYYHYAWEAKDNSDELEMVQFGRGAIVVNRGSNQGSSK